jgi:hypothetical protein
MINHFPRPTVVPNPDDAPGALRQEGGWAEIDTVPDTFSLDLWIEKERGLDLCSEPTRGGDTGKTEIDGVTELVTSEAKFETDWGSPAVGALNGITSVFGAGRACLGTRP